GAFSSSTELDAKLRRALADLATRRQAVGRQRAELGRQQEQRKQLVDDEKRLRDNLAAVGSDPALHKRLLDKFSETETAIETLSAQIAKSADTLAAAERDLAAFTAGMTL